MRHGSVRVLTLKLLDQLGHPAANVRVSLGGVRGVNGIRSISDSRGRVLLLIHPLRKGRLKLRLTGPDYARKVLKIRVT